MDARTQLDTLGLSSQQMVETAAALSDLTGRSVPVEVMWESRTLADLAAAVLRDRPLEHARGAVGAGDREPIAVVGLACRLPGAPDKGAFWRLLVSGASAIGEPAPSRRATTTGSAGHLDEVDRFDAEFFRISPREAEQVDPQQRLVLELSWEALEDAGIPADSLDGSRTGVFVGATWQEYGEQVPTGALTGQSGPGQTNNAIANRVSYTFGFDGPSLAVDTACSSSLVALHLAVQSLRSGESSAALVGGVSLMLSNRTSVILERLGALSPTGVCRAFGADADGYVRGEGGAVVVLKRLSDALRSGDRVYCVVRGSAVANGGARNGFAAPSPRGQRAVLLDACAAAGIDPADVDYVEAHGTGTPLGDPVEAAALAAVHGARRAPDAPLRIGSVKTNIGHLEAAAGITGLCKVALSLHHGALVPTLNADRPNPAIPFAESGLVLQRAVEPWPAVDRPAAAGVSSFGWGGTGAHVVLESSPTTATDIEVLRELPNAPGQGTGFGPVFVFSPHGGQHALMGRDLLAAEPVFRAAVVECDRYWQPLAGWSLVDALATGSHADRLDEPAIGQPLLFAVQVGQARLLRHWGVEPSAVVGHSIGELAAAYICGGMRPEDVVTSLYHYTRVQEEADRDGRMALVELSADEVSERLPEGAGVWVAARNGPLSTVVSGGSDDIAAVVSAVRARGGRADVVNVLGGVHSPLVDAAARQLDAELWPVRGTAPRVPMITTVGSIAGEQLALGTSGHHWSRNLRDQVDLVAATRGLVGRVFVEIGPHPVLAKAIGQTVGEPAAVVPAGRRERSGQEALRDCLARLVEAGVRLSEPVARPRDGRVVLPLSAHTPAALAVLARRLRGHVETASLAGRDVARTCSAHRSFLAYRAVITAADGAEMLAGLDAVADQQRAACLVTGRDTGSAPRLVFVFSGQGSHWAGMGRDLLGTEPVFAATIAACERALAPHVDWSLREQLTGDGHRLSESEVLQPTLFAVQFALAELWRSWGVVPDAVLGHSLGEVAAACFAGALSLTDAAKLIALRGRLLTRVQGHGAMLATDLTPERAEEVAAATGGRVSVAVRNSRRSTVLAGDTDALDELADKLVAEGVFAKRVDVGFASHSRHVDPVLDELKRSLADVKPRPARIPLRSTVTGDWVEGTDLDAEYWAANLRRPVLFGPSVGALMAERPTDFLEISPHPVLSSAMVDELRARGTTDNLILPSLRREQPGHAGLHTSLAELFCRGRRVDWSKVQHDGDLIDLPSYPWQRERHWADSAEPSSDEVPQRPVELLGDYIRTAAHADTHVWEFEVSTARMPYLADHGVDELAIVPGATYSLLVVAAAARVLTGPFRLVDLVFRSPLFLHGADRRIVQLTVTAGEPGRSGVQVFSRSADSAEESATWTLHATGALVQDGAGVPGSAPVVVTDVVSGPGWESLPGSVHYERAAQVGIHLGPSLAGMEAVWRKPGELLACVGSPDQVDTGPAFPGLHPVVVDLAYQALLLSAGLDDRVHWGAFVPARIGSVEVFGTPRPGSAVWAHVHRTAARGDDDAYEGDITLLDERSVPLLKASGLRFERLRIATGGPSAAPATDHLLHAVTWRPVPQPAGQEHARYLVVADLAGFGERLVGVLSAAGAPCTVVRPGADLATALHDWATTAGPERRVVVHTASLDIATGDLPADRVLGDVERLGAGSVLAVAQAVIDLDLPAAARPELCVVTRGAHAVAGGPPGDPGQAPGAAVVRTIRHEHPELRARAVDLAPQGEPGEAGVLAALLAGPDPEPEIAVRGGLCYAPALTRWTPPAGGAALPVRADATYLITGGTGAIGLEVARHLTTRGARRLVLLSRGGASGAAQEAVDGFAARGVDVRVVAGDVADPGVVAEVLRDARAAGKPVRGVLHAAGVLDDGALVGLRPERVRAVLRPKIAGAWNLHESTRDHDLDFFVLCSSAATLLGGPGQANYVAANAFLDALAQVRGAAGLPAVSIAWGAWTGAGLAAENGRAEHLAARGLTGMSAAEAIAALDRAWEGSPAHVAVMAFDAGTWVARHPASADGIPGALVAEPDRPVAAPLPQSPAPTRAVALPEAPAAQGTAAAPVPVSPDAPTAAALAAAPSGPARRQVLDQHLREAIAEVLGQRPERIDQQTPLVNLGLDSLLALELRNKLEASTGVALPATVFWAYPTVDELSPHLAGLLGHSLEAEVETTAVPAPDGELRDMLSTFASMSPEQMRGLVAGGSA